MRIIFRVLAPGGALALLLLLQPAGASEHNDLMKAKKYAEAERAASATLAANPANMRAMVERTAAIMASGNENRVGEAVTQAEQCAASPAATADCHMALGMAIGVKAANSGLIAIISSAGRIRDAFKKAVELDPRNMKARFALLQFYVAAPGMMGGGAAKAEALTAQTAIINPEAGKLMQAMLDLSSGKLAQAEAGVLAVRAGTDQEMLDRQEGLLINVAEKYMAEKKFADAERVALDTAKRFPDGANGPFLMARTQQEQARHREALAGFDQVLAKIPKPQVYYRIGQSLQALGEKAKAVAAYEKALAFKTGLPRTFRASAQEQLDALKR